MFIFDSSAIIDILQGNQQLIEKYGDNPLTTISLVYGEVYLYHLKAKIPEEKCREIPFAIIDFSLADIEESMRLLYERKKATKDFSFVDAVIYTVAKKNNMSLVTKDFGFKGLPGVEFVNPMSN